MVSFKLQKWFPMFLQCVSIQQYLGPLIIRPQCLTLIKHVIVIYKSYINIDYIIITYSPKSIFSIIAKIISLLQLYFMVRIEKIGSWGLNAYFTFFPQNKNILRQLLIKCLKWPYLKVSEGIKRLFCLSLVIMTMKMFNHNN